MSTTKRMGLILALLLTAVICMSLTACKAQEPYLSDGNPVAGPAVELVNTPEMEEFEKEYTAQYNEKPPLSQHIKSDNGDNEARLEELKEEMKSDGLGDAAENGEKPALGGQQVKKK